MAKKQPKASAEQKAQDALKMRSEDTPQDAGGQEIQHNEDGSATVSFDDQDPNEDQVNGGEPDGGLGSYDQKSEHYGNLVLKVDSDQANKLANLVILNVQADEMARAEWMRTIQLGLDLLGVKVEEKNTPFEGACSAQHPLLMESAVKFQSKASNELLPAAGPVKTLILGDATPEKEEQAARVKNHMNYQITEEMTEFYTDSEKLLLYISLIGSGFKKTYYNAHLERPCSEFVTADQFVVPNNSCDLYRADRYTHILSKTDYQLEADCAAGLYEMPENGLGAPAEAKSTDFQKKTNELMGVTISLTARDRTYTLYEQHIMLFIEGLDEVVKADGRKYKLASPYILTVDSVSKKLIGLRRNWKEDDKKRKKKVQFTHYCFVPSFNFYGFGFLHLLGNLQLSLTSSLRSLVDAGQFANLQGGFKLKGVRILDDGSPIHPGQFKDLECAVQDINKALMVMPFKEPSSVLYQMLEFLDRKGQQFADSTEQVVSDSANYGPVGTTMALLEASAKFFSAIHKRLHNSLKQELRNIADINSETLADDTAYNIENQTMRISRKDYGPAVAITPVSDPNISSSAHRMAKAQALLAIAQQAPQGMYDLREINRHVLINMDYASIDKVLPPPTDAQPQDPLTDIQSASAGKPIKAFPGQDHKAHIAIKQAFMQDPMSGQNPVMQKVSIVVQANVQEHMLLQFVEQVQATVKAAQGQGQPDGSQAQTNAPQAAPQAGQGPQAQQPGQQPQQPPDPMVQAAQQVAQINQQILKNQAAPPPQPRDQAALMLAQAETQDTQTKAKKQTADAEHKQQQIEIAKQKLEIDKAKVMQEGNFHKSNHEHEINKLVVTKGLDHMLADQMQTQTHNTQHSLGQQKIHGQLANTKLTADLTPTPPQPSVQ
jgi:hypothetical protein